MSTRASLWAVLRVIRRLTGLMMAALRLGRR